MERVAITAIAICLLVVATPLYAAKTIPPMYQTVADYTGVPAKILYAVALSESGRTVAGKFEPWPWTLNIAGKGKYFDSRQAMFDSLMDVLQSGATNVDIGPMQTNWHWQFERAISPWQITDPGYNIKTAAEILKEHYQATGDWWIAVGKYHRASDKPKHKQGAARYAERVRKRWSRL